MAKKKTSKKLSGSKIKFSEYKPGESLKDPVGVLETLLQCLAEDDLEAFEDVLVAHLRVVNKSKLAAQTKIGRRTLYDLMDPEKPFNPTIQTVGAIFKSLLGARKPNRKIEALAFVPEAHGKALQQVRRRAATRPRGRQGSPSGRRVAGSGKG